jgi:hypothetical protein
MENPLDVIKDERDVEGILERCGENVISDGIQCTHCGCLETYKDGNDPEDVDKWYFMIRAFRVDDSSKCNNCGKWF